mmetsp:Transcript_87616/g.272293  ORF Transcript_87616/g.272293 Transcript_87616/m.272293 type:complete len:172 (-) Transcript_87616:39-554(-)|eukprot:CAMPEP_0204592872 /NCGR_PEP_ID=MMETSP0661-20131031/51183_1 /ASSEMBLY_ACC=CAM_ASM_000606 /TAXON_ID=109239 /ORGANISM="Alexandrium margalefi, Strain AMGDE01CS-322" /LENGTH=171 /DNA_ID=CAMNT_0051603121 /DNA_START=82 /DNA_END=597 /DNA_ORIENTATION=+
MAGLLRMLVAGAAAVACQAASVETAAVVMSPNGEQRLLPALSSEAEQVAAVADAEVPDVILLQQGLQRNHLATPAAPVVAEHPASRSSTTAVESAAWRAVALLEESPFSLIASTFPASSPVQSTRTSDGQTFLDKMLLEPWVHTEVLLLLGVAFLAQALLVGCISLRADKK